MGVWWRLTGRACAGNAREYEGELVVGETFQRDGWRFELMSRQNETLFL